VRLDAIEDGAWTPAAYPDAMRDPDTTPAPESISDAVWRAANPCHPRA
jgi:hypothetical protein